jgi:hypothetical protein
LKGQIDGLKEKSLGVGEAIICDRLLGECAERPCSPPAPADLLRDKDLSAVANRRNASRAVDVDADVSLVGDERLARVEPNAHADRAGLERSLPVGSRSKCIRGPREGDEERISLRIDLDAAMPAEAFAQRLPMLAERIGVGIAELVQKPSRALDVGEEKGDCAGGQLGHTVMMRRLEAKV